jgi:hypothetical protein
VVVAVFGSVVLGAFAVNTPGEFKQRPTSAYRQLAARVTVPLVSVDGLCVDTSSRGAIPLVRALRRHADQTGIGVYATARTPELLDGYHENGFWPLDPTDADADADDRRIYREPGAIPFRPSIRTRRRRRTA